MAGVLDVADYILSKAGEMTAMKLQKLVYYSQAWHLVWDEKALFDEEIQAWANGPVVYELYEKHRGRFRISSIDYENKTLLAPEEKDTIDAVLDSYSQFTAQQLSELTHNEEPWKSAREGLPIGSRSQRIITHAMMSEYYHGIR